MAKQIFLSYRREDSADVTGRIYDRLVQRFDRDAVFKDVDSIPPGTDFRKYLESVINECAVVLVVVGDNWAGRDAATGLTRLEDERDFVRMEIELALRRGVPVIPLLVEGARMPPETDLPEGLREFAYRNALEVERDPDFHPHMDRLISYLEELFERQGCGELVRPDAQSAAWPQTHGGADAAPVTGPLAPHGGVTATHGAARGLSAYLSPKSGYGKWLLGIGCLATIITGVVSVPLAIFFVVGRGPSGTNEPPRAEGAAVAAAGTPTPALPAGAAPGTRQYVNRQSDLAGKLAENHVAFSFSYPASWELDPEGGKADSSYFVKVQRNGDGPWKEAMLERLTVGEYESGGSVADDRFIFWSGSLGIGSSLDSLVSDYEKVSEGETTVGPYTGYELRYKANAKRTGRKGVLFWERIIFLPSISRTQKRGLILCLAATSLAPEIKGLEDVGVKGELPSILKSFRIGP